MSQETPIILAVLIAVLTVPAFAVLNHVRGGGALFGIVKLPGRGQWYLWAPIFVAGVLNGLDWLDALYFAGAWVVWSIPEWGRWFRLGHYPAGMTVEQGRLYSSGEPGWFGRLIEFPGWNDTCCFTARNCIMVLPLAYLSPWLLLLGPVQTLCYAVAWSAVDGLAAIAYGELLTGAAWGIALVSLAVLK